MKKHLLIILGLFFSFSSIQSQSELFEWVIPLGDKLIYPVFDDAEETEDRKSNYLFDYNYPDSKIFDLQTEKWQSFTHDGLLSKMTQDGKYFTTDNAGTKSIIDVETNERWPTFYNKIEYLGNSYFQVGKSSYNDQKDLINLKNKDFYHSRYERHLSEVYFVEGDIFGARTGRNETIILFDENGEELFTLPGSYADYCVGEELVFYSEKRVENERNYRTAVYNQRGKELIGFSKLVYPTILPINNGMVLFFEDNIKKAIDFEGNEIKEQVKIETKTDKVQLTFDNELNHKLGLYFNESEVDIPASYDKIRVSPDLLLTGPTKSIQAIKGDTTDYYNFNGELLYTNSTYDESWHLSDNYYMVRNENYCGIVDKSGNVIVPIDHRKPGFLQNCEGTIHTYNDSIYFHMLNRRGDFFLYTEEGELIFELTEGNYNSSVKWMNGHLSLLQRTEKGIKQKYGIISIDDRKVKKPFEYTYIYSNKYAKPEDNNFAVFKNSENYRLSLVHLPTMEVLVSDCNWITFLSEKHVYIDRNDQKIGLIKLK